MADRYWVGGAGNWSNIAKWSTTSGGAGGASVPTAADNVYFNAASGGGAVNLDVVGNCLSLNLVGFTGGLSGNALNIYGNLDMGSTATSMPIYFYFRATSGTWTIQGGSGITPYLAYVSIVPNAASTAVYNLGSNFPFCLTFDVNGGTFNTNNYSMSLGSLGSSSRATTMNLGSSTISFSGGSGYGLYLSSSLLTLNAGTSTLTTNSANGLNINADGKTLYNVNIDSPYDNSPPAGINGNITFNNLTIKRTAAYSNHMNISIGGNLTINGTLTVVGSASVTSRLRIMSDSTTRRSITATSKSLTNVDFYNIAGNSFSGTSIGDIGSNTGITFTSAKTVYFSGSSGKAFSDNVWATSSGGAASNSNYPLPQDTLIIDNSSVPSGGTVVASGIYAGTIQMSTRSLPLTFSAGNISICGNMSYSSSVTNAGTGTMTFMKTATISGTPANGYTAPIVVNSGVTLSVTNSFNSTGSITINGAFSANGIMTPSLVNNGTLSHNGMINAGSITNSGSWSITTPVICDYLTLTGTTTWSGNQIIINGSSGTVYNSVGVMVNPGSSAIYLSYSGATGTRTISSSASEANSVNFYVNAGSDTVTVNGSVRSLDFTGFSGTLANGSTTIYGNVKYVPEMTINAGTNTTTFGATSGTQTITTNGKVLDFPININGAGGTKTLSDNLTQGSSRVTTLTNGTLNLNGKTLTVGQFATAAGTKNITFNGGTLLIPAVTTTAFNNAQPAGFTTTLGTGSGKISMTGATDKTFVGGGSTYNCIVENAGAGALTITGSNTFTTLSNSVQPTSFIFTSGTTQTVTNFNVSGTPDNLVTITASSTSNATLSKSSGIVNVSYCNISKSTAAGGATWLAPLSSGNINSGSNTGWSFITSGNGLLFGSNF